MRCVFLYGCKVRSLPSSGVGPVWVGMRQCDSLDMPHISFHSISTEETTEISSSISRSFRQLLMVRRRWRLLFARERGRWPKTTRPSAGSNWWGFPLPLAVSHRLKWPLTSMPMVLSTSVPRTSGQAKNSKVSSGGGHFNYFNIWTSSGIVKERRVSSRTIEGRPCYCYLIIQSALDYPLVRLHVQSTLHITILVSCSIHHNYAALATQKFVFPFWITPYWLLFYLLL